MKRLMNFAEMPSPDGKAYLGRNTVSAAESAFTEIGGRHVSRSAFRQIRKERIPVHRVFVRGNAQRELFPDCSPAAKPVSRRAKFRQTPVGIRGERMNIPDRQVAFQRVPKNNGRACSGPLSHDRRLLYADGTSSQAA